MKTQTKTKKKLDEKYGNEKRKRKTESRKKEKEENPADIRIPPSDSHIPVSSHGLLLAPAFLYASIWPCKEPHGPSKSYKAF
jgi:hypothetical protein